MNNRNENQSDHRHKMTWFAHQAIFAGLLVLLPSCAVTVHQAYEGPARPAGEIAVLRVAPPLQLRAIDGDPVPIRGGVVAEDSDRIEFLPGFHVVSFDYIPMVIEATSYVSSGLPGMAPVSAGSIRTQVDPNLKPTHEILMFKAKAGHTYRAVCEPSAKSKGIFKPIAVPAPDVGSDNNARKVKTKRRMANPMTDLVKQLAH